MNRHMVIALISLTVVACLQTPQSDQEASAKQSTVAVKSTVQSVNLAPLGDHPTTQSLSGQLQVGLATASNQAVVQAFAQKQSHIWLSGSGQVVKLLPDDNQGARHQRFLLRVNPQQTLLFAHNIDLAPRVAELAVGDEISFRGEYVYHPKGGIMHWTHHDPQGQHHGFIQSHGQTYQ